MKHIHDYTVGELIKMGMNVEVNFNSVHLEEEYMCDGLTKVFVDSLVYKQPLTKYDLEKGGWFLLDVSPNAYQSLKTLYVNIYSKYEWGEDVSYMACAYSTKCNHVERISNNLLTSYKGEGYVEIVMINNKFYWKD